MEEMAASFEFLFDGESVVALLSEFGAKSVAENVGVGIASQIFQYAPDYFPPGVTSWRDF